MKIIKIGHFEHGIPIGWTLDGEGSKKCYAATNDKSKGPYILGLDLDYVGSVSVNGVEIKEWSDARKKSFDR